jgi:hypothetical protein
MDGPSPMPGGSWVDKEAAEAAFTFSGRHETVAPQLPPLGWCAIRSTQVAVRLDLNLLLCSGLDQRAADCLGLRLDAPLTVSLSFDADARYAAKRPAKFALLELECSQPRAKLVGAPSEDGQKAMAPFGCRTYVPDLIDRYLRDELPRLAPTDNFLVSIGDFLRVRLDACCRCLLGTSLDFLLGTSLDADFLRMCT